MTRNCPLACADRLEGATANPTNRFLQQTYDTVHINLINHSGEFHAARSSKHSSLSRSRGASFDGSIMSACSRVHSTYMCKHPGIITLMTIIIKCITRRAVRTKASLILTAFTLHVSNVSSHLSTALSLDRMLIELLTQGGLTQQDTTGTRFSESLAHLARLRRGCANERIRARRSGTRQLSRSEASS